MKKMYQSPTVQQIVFAQEDVVRTSGTPDAENDFFSMGAVTTTEVFG